jgi:hypothetical protein|tara:strand:- start:114 stop:257 length:144 start_codon:yes stop_codon:yes gene_type:complete
MKEVKEATKMPAGLHIESGWADKDRKEEQKKSEDLNAWLKGQLGFGS